MKKAFLLLIILIFGFLSIVGIPKVYAETDKTITYDLETNIITAIGGNETDPINFNDLWEADRNSYLILDQENHTSSPNTFTLDQQIRLNNETSLYLGFYFDFDDPFLDTCDLTVRGYHTKDLYKEETYININAHFNTSDFNDYWASLINITITFTGNWVDLYVFQWQWGVVWKTGESQFMFDARIILGNGTVAGTTWFGDTNKQIIFSEVAISDHYQLCIDAYRSYAFIKFGVLESATNKLGSQGISLISLDTYANNYLIRTFEKSYFYGCYFRGGTNLADRFLGAQFSHVYNCVFEEVDFYGTPCIIDAHDLTIRNAETALYYAQGTLDTIRIYKNTYAIKVATTYPLTVKNLYARNQTTNFCRSYGITTDKYLINVDSDDWTFNWGTGNTAEVYRQYEFHLNITDIEGSPIENANVTISHYGYNPGVDFTVLTGANGSFSTKTLTMEFYNQTGGNTPYSYNPFNIEIEAPSYDTYSGNFTLDEAITSTIILQRNYAIGLGSGFILAFILSMALLAVGAVVISRRRS